MVELALPRKLSGYLAIALTVAGIGISILIQGAYDYFYALASYHAHLNFCHAYFLSCPAFPSFNGSQDLVLVGFGLVIVCLGIALLFTELSGSPRLEAEKITV